MSLFKVFFLIVSVIIFWGFYSALDKIPWLHWHNLHKHIIILLLAQIFYNGPLSFLSTFIHINPLLVFLFEESIRALFYGLLLYFWVSFLDSLLLGDANYSREGAILYHILAVIKLGLLALIIFLKVSLKLPSLYRELKPSYIDLEGEDNVTLTLQSALETALLVYFVYYLILFIAIKCCGIKPSITTNRAVNLLFLSSLFAFLVYWYNISRGFSNPLNTSAETQISLLSCLNIYTIMLAYLFTPKSLGTAKNNLPKDEAEDAEIISDVYGSEMVEIPQSDKREAEAKRRVWDQIAQSVDKETKKEPKNRKALGKDENLSDEEKDLEYFN
eukprot:TRINITY_DN6079_c0_g1_i5.p1 TRINITY_DN6079_c0_g1~~TRINITY_DN6079_c0_g1_i5.p1  ORF type:complete len:330 (-),score=61.75 TRINITY_DN6079_c0_g1_i5:127-1116(-)